MNSSTRISATARATAKSYASLCAASWPRVSARPHRVSALVMPILAMAPRTKPQRFLSESSIRTWPQRSVPLESAAMIYQQLHASGPLRQVALHSRQALRALSLL